jgi:uncharacterized protein (TIGR03435 family)
MSFSEPAVFAAFLVFLPVGLSAQTPTEFAAAVIRPSEAGPGAGSSFNTFEGGRVRIVNEPVRLLIRAAYRLQNAQIAGGPGWLDSDLYDIEAKTGGPEKPGPRTLSPYLQSLLESRFQFKFHRESRPLTVGALVVDAKGPKLKVTAPDTSSGMNTHPGLVSRVDAAATSMEALAMYVGNRLDRIVVDQTGLKGSYDFTLQWSRDDAPYDKVPPLLDALREQLGLRLETRKAPVEVLVIDSIQKPSAN